MQLPSFLTLATDALDRIRSSLWFVPTLMLGAGLGLAMVAIQLDHWYGSTIWKYLPWFRSMRASSAELVLSTIAGSMVTVTGIVFSMTIVALTLASSQFGPRLLRTFMRSRVTQAVLGLFIATFLYCLATLCSIDAEAEFVPRLSVALALVISIGTMAVLVFFIHHVAASMQVSNIVATVSEELDHQIDKLYPDQLSTDSTAEKSRGEDPAASFDEEGANAVLAGVDGYVRAIDEKTAMDACEEHDLRIQFCFGAGQFVVRGAPVIQVTGRSGIDDEITDELRRCVVIGDQRTAVQDIEFCLNQLVDIALRALSPGINDPRTAISCVHRLGQALGRSVGRAFPPPIRCDEDGVARLWIRSTSFRAMIRACYDRIAKATDGNEHVITEILQTLDQVSRVATDPDRRRDLMEARERYGDDSQS